LDLSVRYNEEGADELVFYDITASPDQRRVDRSWVNKVASKINIPFCVAGGIRSINDAEEILNYGADKISINTPAIERPELISELANNFGSQCVVVGIDSYQKDSQYLVYSHTGNPETTKKTKKETSSWAREVEERGAGEIVLNCINQDGVRKGYDVEQLMEVNQVIDVPLIASGGAGQLSDFSEVILKANVSGTLAASVFHKNIINIYQLKVFLKSKDIEVRL
jgi:cyclase